MVAQNITENALPTGAAQAAAGDGERYRDYPHWQELAAKRGLRMPAKSMALSTRMMKRWLRRLGLTPAQHDAWAGLASLGAFIDRNRDLPLYAWVGLMLELVEWGGPEA